MALAHMAIASDLATKEQITETLEYERARVLETRRLRCFLRRGIGRAAASERGLQSEIDLLDNKVQFINMVLLRL